jgi:hypothetical protein
LTVDAHNRIRFTEEFANKLAGALQNSVAWIPLAQDTFGRPDQALWGTASDGQTWGAGANTARAFSIANKVGKISSGNGTYYAVLGPTATDAEVLFSGSISNYANSYLGALVRWSNTDNRYKATLGAASLSIQKRVGGSTTALGSVHVAPKKATSCTLRLRVVGAALYAKVWQTGAAEPANWMLTIRDIALSSGFCGLSTKVGAGVIVKYTSFGASNP